VQLNPGYTGPQTPIRAADAAEWATAQSSDAGEAGGSQTRPQPPELEETAPVVRHQDPEEEAGLLSSETLSGLAPSSIFKSVRQYTPWKIDEVEGRQLMDEAEELYRQQKFAEAAAKFDKAAWKWPDSVLEEDALFYLGECYFFTDQYAAAGNAYADLLKKYSNTRHLDVVMRRQFRIGRYWQEINRVKPHWPLVPNFTDDTRPWFDTDGNALATYESVWMGDPTGPLADDAVIETANAYFLDESFQDADYYYDMLREQHPQSEHLIQAFTLGVQAKLRTYQGPGYDGSPLTEAEELVEQMLVQFPNELGDDRQRVLETKQQIHELQAERLWHMASYYGKNDYYGAERKYLRTLLDDYHDTTLAPRAQERMAEIAARPDNPPQRLRKFLEATAGEE
jgi:outer membrane protein assembly factor BamD (BamD/ComL family)